MRLRIVLPLLLSAAFVAACGTSPDGWLLSKYGKHSTLSSLTVCKNYGCSARVTVALTAAEWNDVTNVFAARASDAAGEREQIRHAIAIFETVIGPKSGTANDRAGADLISFDREGQMDCIDEAFNTTSYLDLLARAGLLRLHDVGAPQARGFFIDQRPHNTATLVERSSGVIYAVDSWFHENGAMPETVSLKTWLAGWIPPQG